MRLHHLFPVRRGYADVRRHPFFTGKFRQLSSFRSSPENYQTLIIFPFSAVSFLFRFIPETFVLDLIAPGSHHFYPACRLYPAGGRIPHQDRHKHISPHCLQFSERQNLYIFSLTSDLPCHGAYRVRAPELPDNPACFFQMFPPFA